MNSVLHYVYIVRCVDDTLYTGYTTDVARRIATHNAGKGARYTRTRLPIELLVSWEFASKNEALRIEYALKRWSRRQKLLLIETPTRISLLTDPADGLE
ncbi:GIY-YIG nuclease family protein [Dictyobacter formicarum]|uniref:GIY-YIG nuclease family protein n=1 Tax=Dictyobacter formicarum TaxID=2778368 RepID=UPI0019162C7F|nr:GIY-YIG nuclease family protein [Dictyobacter formicarum]